MWKNSKCSSIQAPVWNDKDNSANRHALCFTFEIVGSYAIWGAAVPVFAVIIYVLIAIGGSIDIDS